MWGDNGADRRPLARAFLGGERWSRFVTFSDASWSTRWRAMQGGPAPRSMRPARRIPQVKLAFVRGQSWPKTANWMTLGVAEERGWRRVPMRGGDAMSAALMDAALACIIAETFAPSNGFS